MRISNLIRTELDPAARLDICVDSSSSSSSKRRFRARGTTFVSGCARIALVISFGSGGHRFFLPPGLCLYHVLTLTKFPWQISQRHSRRSLGLAILRGDIRRAGSRKGEFNVAGLRQRDLGKMKKKSSSIRAGFYDVYSSLLKQS